jgi:succinate dehydrogenase / fumarate reductase cytochrome b subunit
MSKSTATRARPLSPHLTVYRPTITMTMSIVHRATGMALYAGTLLVAWWLVATSTSQNWFDIANAVLGSWLGLLVLVGFTWAMYHHAIGGIRHALWDVGYAIDKSSASALSWASLAGSILFTALTWAVFLFAF